MKLLKKKRQKLFAYFMLIIFTLILFPLLPPVDEALAAGLTVPQCANKYADRTPPPGYPTCIQLPGGGTAKPFNQKLWDDQQVVVYGTELDVNLAANDFKTKWQTLDGKPRTNSETTVASPHPYYTKNGARGEYRYYGYDQNGSKYTNPYFLDDAKSGLEPGQKKWVYRPWESSLTIGNKQRPTAFSPIFGDQITKVEEIYSRPGMVDAIDRIVQNDAFNGGILEASRGTPKDSNTSRNTRHLFDYMYVEQAPSVWGDGQGRMFHQQSDGEIWYQSFTVDKLTGKKKPGMLSTTIQPRESMEMDLSKLPDTWKWTFDFQSIMNDNRKVDPADQQVMYKDEFRKLEYYTRADVAYWKFLITYNIGGQPQRTVTVTTDDSGKVTYADGRATGNYFETLTFMKSDFTAGDTINIQLKAEVHYGTTNVVNVFDSGTTLLKKTFTQGTKPVIAQVDSVPPQPPYPPPMPYLPPPLQCMPIIPNHAFDIVAYPASDNTDESKVKERRVWVDGVEVNDVAFFSGEYVFGDEADGLHYIAVRWIPNPPDDPQVPPDYDQGCTSQRWIHVHDTKPRAQFKFNGGLFKENRKMSIDDTSALAIDPYVQAAYPITGWSWSWSAIEGSDSDRRMKVDGEQHKEFLYKKPGEYQVTLTVTNALGRTSEAYVLPFTVLKDENPALIFYPYSSQISREDAVTFVDDAVSTDYDSITTQTIEVYYDVNGDESYSELIDTLSGPLTQYKPAASRLGKYRIKLTVEEDFGQETFPEFLTAADKRRTTKQFEFMVDNYIPYNDIYTDIPAIRPQIDTYFMADKNLAQNKIDYLKSSMVTINNGLRKEGADPQVNMWDMHTYTYSQPGSTTYNTGTSYPPARYYWCSSGGYCGTLDRQSATDNGSNVDFGYDATKQMSDSRTATGSSCQVSGFVPAGQDGSSLSCPSSQSYSSGGYSGTLSCNYSYSSQGVYDSKGKYLGYNFSRSCSYSGTVTKTWTETYHVYDWRWVANWYGFYTGTIYKDIRQAFTNPFTRTASEKYVIYISENIINELPDFNMVKGISDAKIIVVGSPPITGQSSPADFIENKGQPIEQLVQSVIDNISTKFAPTATQTVLVNEAFNLLTEETDPESDPIIQKQMQYVHDEYYFDNPTGHASYAGYAFDPAKYGAESMKTSFADPGAYHIFRRVKDQPSTDPKFAKYSYFSNDAETIVRVHRKPIAQAVLDWTYDTNCSCYFTRWEDQSYDLDHNVSDPVDKGIVERKIRYQFNGEWYYRIPDELAPGSYRLEYTVKDIEGAWSDPFVLTFTLAATPPPQLKAKLKATDGTFTTADGVPASESVTAYELWTRFPQSLSLQFLMHTSGNYINQTVNYFTGTKNGSDIRWNDVMTTIPATTPDGSYTYRIQANGSNGTTAYLDFPVKVVTPIRLQPEIRTAIGQSTSTLTVGQPVTITAATTEYPSQVTVTAFKGQSFQKSLTMAGNVTSTIGAGRKEWNASFTPQKPIPDGTYTFEWTARTPNGNVEIKTMSVKAVNNTAPTGDFTVFTYQGTDASMPIFEGDTVHIRSLNLTDQDRDALLVRYEVFDPAGVKKLDDSATVAYPYAPSGPDFALPAGTTAVGVWSVKQTISDGKAPPVIRTRTFQVRALGIQGAVKHTEAWEANRLRYNEKHPNAVRPPDWFWAGEAFVLEATVTDTGSSGTQPVSVVAEASQELRKALNEVRFSQLWSGILRSEDTSRPLNELPEGTYSFVFTVTYSNGIVKKSTVTVRLRDTIDDYVQVHRVQ